MNHFESVLYTRLKMAVAEQHQKVTEQLGYGGVETFEAYKDFVGYLRGLRDAMDLADHIKEEMSKE